MWELESHSLPVQPGSGVDEGKAKIMALLKDGWEPFAVTRTSEYVDYHLRRQVEQ